ncbi:uncharacterized protein EI90DRAFT_3074370 [Cantharellus anzutake]|uniref:uncharacterized protein n=1 Tax=Cantharellus anzutake TaxID=1750568 RepID=UPI001905F302|nr:uncharacterized protein EI90DRAFT_3074370 [Cantharellus anzutake]KAF8324904.1 hypothetical protein EI90DRAFT_3074370 [Cantharellus anzutake]
MQYWRTFAEFLLPIVLRAELRHTLLKEPKTDISAPHFFPMVSLLLQQSHAYGSPGTPLD